MDEFKISGIYKITNKLNNKMYVGSSINIYTRFYEHQKMLEKGIHHSIKLQNSYNKAKDKSIYEYSIIEKVDDVSNLKDREQYYIDLYDSYYNGYNCREKATDQSYGERIKKKSKKVKKEELENLYKEFWDLYDSNFCDFGSQFMVRLNSKHYKNITIAKINTTIKWFLENYDTSLYYFYFRFFNSPIHSGNFNPQIIVRRKSDDYDMGVYQIQKQRIIKIYDGDN